MAQHVIQRGKEKVKQKNNMRERVSECHYYGQLNFKIEKYQNLLQMIMQPPY